MQSAHLRAKPGGKQRESNHLPRWAGARGESQLRERNLGKATEAFKALAGNSTCNRQPGAPPRPCGWRSTGRRRGVPWQLQLRLQPGPWSSSHHLRDTGRYHPAQHVAWTMGHRLSAACMKIFALSPLRRCLCPFSNSKTCSAFGPKKPGRNILAPQRGAAARSPRGLVTPSR